LQGLAQEPLRGLAHEQSLPPLLLVKLFLTVRARFRGSVEFRNSTVEQFNGHVAPPPRSANRQDVLTADD
jgi:hypothetical protein